MKKNFVVVLLVMFLLSMLNCVAESEPTMIPSTITANTDLAKCDAVDFLQPMQGELLFVTITADIVLGSTNLDTDKLMISTDNVYISYDYDSPSLIFLSYFNEDSEFVLIAYDLEYNEIVYQFIPLELTPTQFATYGELMIADVYDEWRELDTDVLEFMIEMASTAISE